MALRFIFICISFLTLVIFAHFFLGITYAQSCEVPGKVELHSDFEYKCQGKDRYEYEVKSKCTDKFQLEKEYKILSVETKSIACGGSGKGNRISVSTPTGGGTPGCCGGVYGNICPGKCTVKNGSCSSGLSCENSGTPVERTDCGLSENKDKPACKVTAQQSTTTSGDCIGGALGSVFGCVKPPSQVSNIGRGAAGLSKVFTNLLALIYTAAAIVFVFMIVIGAFQWIVSGGDKEAVAGARKRITHAIIGIVILALAFVIIATVGAITRFKFFAG